MLRRGRQRAEAVDDVLDELSPHCRGILARADTRVWGLCDRAVDAINLDAVSAAAPSGRSVQVPRLELGLGPSHELHDTRDAPLHLVQAGAVRVHVLRLAGLARLAPVPAAGAVAVPVEAVGCAGGCVVRVRA